MCEPAPAICLVLASGGILQEQAQIHSRLGTVHHVEMQREAIVALHAQEFALPTVESRQLSQRPLLQFENYELSQG